MTKKMNLDEVRAYMEQQGVESFGIDGLGDKYVSELQKLGATAADEIEIFEPDFRGIITEEGCGTVNGRVFCEDEDSCELKLFWLDEQ